MSDFFREVDEELRNDRMRAFWKNYRFFIIGGVALIVLSTAAFRFYVYWTDQQAGVSGDRYLEALERAENGDRAGAQTILSELEKDGTGAYPMLARFRSAGALLSSGSTNEAVAAFDALASDSSVPDDLQGFARLQASVAAVDVESYDKIVARTEPLLASDNPWRHLAKEALALSAWKEGNLTEAAKWVQELLQASDIPQGLGQRVRILQDLIISQGGKLPDIGSG